MRETLKGEGGLPASAIDIRSAANVIRPFVSAGGRRTANRPETFGIYPAICAEMLGKAFAMALMSGLAARQNPIVADPIYSPGVPMSNFQAERENMIESQIRPNGVTNVALLRAMREMPREVFVPPSQRNLAYMDGALRVEAARDGRPARYLLPPMVFAKLAQLAAVKETDRVLDIGPATGYSTAILAKLAKEVIGVECDAGLAALAQDALSQEGIENAKLITGPLEEGAPEEEPFDVIFVNGRLGCEPEKLLTQLTAGGRLVAIMGTETAPKGRLFTKIDSTIQDVMAFDAGAPLLPGFDPKPVFTF